MEMLIGIVFGSIVTCILVQIRWRVTGTLKIDHSNPEKDVYRFEIDDLDNLDKRRHVLLKVDHNADLSQK